MRTFIASAALALTSLGLPAAAQAQDMQMHDEMEQTRLVAVLSYADWCGSCRILDPRIQEVRAENSFEGVEFVRLDYTERDSATYFEQAQNANVESAVRAHFGDQIRTGLLLLVDLDDGEVVSVINREYSAEDIAQTVQRYAAEA